MKKYFKIMKKKFKYVKKYFKSLKKKIKSMKKQFHINSQLKKYLLLFIIALCLILLISTSYALLRSSQIGENVYVMNVGNLEITFLDSETNALTVNNMVPVTDEEGMAYEKELVFTIKNTGDYDALYNLYIEETSTNPEFKSVIRYISNKNDVGYNSPKTLSEDKYLDTMASLAVGETANYRVKVWLDEQADATYMNKSFMASVVIESIQGNMPVRYFVEESIKESTCNPVIEEDGIIYLSGTADCVNFNYVWYSGKLWRVTAIYPDGSMKLITDNIMTTISYGSDYNFYVDDTNKSYVYEWLNEDFLDTLYNYENIIVTNSKWVSSAGDGNVSTKLDKNTTINANVGLLNSYEYYMSYRNANNSSGYLNNGYYWWLLNRYDTSSTNVSLVSDTGGYSSSDSGAPTSIRPVINLKSDIKLEGGKGTKTEPYRIKGDNTEVIPNTTLLNTRQSGEYVRINNELFRIVGINDSTTKLTKEDYLKSTNNSLIKKAFASTATYGSSSNTKSDTYWDYYLNNTWLKNFDSTYDETNDTSDMLTKGTYYLGKVLDTGHYKPIICQEVNSTTKNCEKITTTWTGYVGLLRYGEIFATQIGSSSSSSDMWLISPFASSTARTVAISGVGRGGFSGPSSTLVSRPTINLKSTIVIKSGIGTKQDPFIVGL